ncbi:hypothetical protein AAG570_005172 [Ranatra chinensis]|uniref:SEA domain-containing protein n=1 Tax=Ranatra chinensis TaxID=642074 RepID=A0ABD0Y195_9HEMI
MAAVRSRNPALLYTISSACQHRLDVFLWRLPIVSILEGCPVDSDITFDDDGSSWRHARGVGPSSQSSDHQEDGSDLGDDGGLLHGLVARVKRQLDFGWLFSKKTTPAATTTTEAVKTSSAATTSQASNENEIIPSPTEPAAIALSTRTVDRETRSTDYDDASPGVTRSDRYDGQGQHTSDDEDMPENSGDRESGETPTPDWPLETKPTRSKRSVYRFTVDVHEPYEESFSDRGSPAFQKFAQAVTSAVDDLFANFPGKQNSRVITIQPTSDHFYSQVTVDLGSVGNSDSKAIEKHIKDQVETGRIGDIAVKNWPFTFRDFTDEEEDEKDDHKTTVGSTSPTEATVTKTSVGLVGASKGGCRGDDATHCSDGVTVICSVQICDGTPDCPGGDDEHNCPPIEDGLLQTSKQTVDAFLCD